MAAGEFTAILYSIIYYNWCLLALGSIYSYRKCIFCKTIVKQKGTSCFSQTQRVLWQVSPPGMTNSAYRVWTQQSVSGQIPQTFARDLAVTAYPKSSFGFYLNDRNIGCGSTLRFTLVVTSGYSVVDLRAPHLLLC